MKLQQILVNSNLYKNNDSLFNSNEISFQNVVMQQLPIYLGNDLDKNIMVYKCDHKFWSDYGNAKPDLIAISEDYNYYSIIEVELSHHSWESHVARQVKCLVNAEYSNQKEKIFKNICNTNLNSRLDEMQAAFLRVKLRYLNKESRYRKEVGVLYTNGINNSDIRLPIDKNVSSITNLDNHVFHLYVIQTNHRDKLQKYLLSNGVHTLIHYPIPPSHQVAYKDYLRVNTPITNSIHKNILSIPISLIIEKSDVNKIIKLINRFGSKL